MRQVNEYLILMTEIISTRLATVNDRIYAQVVSDWTATGNMLRKDADVVFADFNKGRAVLAFIGDELVGHSAITYLWEEHGYRDCELGGVFTSPSHRGKGIATVAIQETILLAREILPDHRIVALANSASEPIFIRLGGRKMQTTEMDPEAWEPCKKSCNRYKAPRLGEVFVCCDTPYDLSQVQIRRR